VPSLLDVGERDGARVDPQATIATSASAVGCPTGSRERHRHPCLARAADSSDGRAIDVFLTAAGAELADALRVRIARALAPAFDQLAPAEGQRLNSLLRRAISPR
jgi:hypothetical protein